MEMQQLTDIDAGGRVLLVEDDAEIADVLRRSLRAEGYEVRTSGDGVEALGRLKSRPPLPSCHLTTARGEHSHTTRGAARSRSDQN